VICSLTNDHARLARYAGVFRGVTALGMMFSFIIDGNGGGYITQLSFQFACYFVGIVFLYIATVFFVVDSNYFKEENVIVPFAVEEKAKNDGRIIDAESGVEGREATGDVAGESKKVDLQGEV